MTQSKCDLHVHRLYGGMTLTTKLKDYYMTTPTFGISALVFIANMSTKQNAINYAGSLSLAATVVDDTFYVDDGLTGAETIDKAIELCKQLRLLFEKD